MKMFLTGTVLMDLSKAFSCVPHDLLTTRLYTYGFGERGVTIVYSYLKWWIKIAKIFDILNTSQSLISNVPQGSILSLAVFDMLLSDPVAALGVQNFWGA